MVSWIGAAAIAAIAGSPHCLGMCGALACAAGEGRGQQSAYHLGRVGTYTLLGAAAGAVGHVIPGPPWVGPAVATLFLLGFVASLAGLVREPRMAIPGLGRAGSTLARRIDLPSRIVFGAVNGLLPCGLVYSTLSLAVASADPRLGAAVMGTFGLFTVPTLVAATFGLRRVVAGSTHARRVLALVVLLTGLGTLGFRAGLFSPDDPAQAGVPPCHRH